MEQHQQQQQSAQERRAAQTQSVILEEKYDESYEPTDDEIAEYAEFLGLDVEAEPHLVWVARAGLKAPLPKAWKPCQTEDGQVYYFNFSTGESVWTHPCDEHFLKLYHDHRKQQPIPPPGWRPGDDAALEEEAIRYFEEARPSTAPLAEETAAHQKADGDDYSNSGSISDGEHPDSADGEHKPQKQQQQQQSTASKSPTQRSEISRVAVQSADTLPPSPQAATATAKKGIRFDDDGGQDSSEAASVSQARPAAVTLPASSRKSSVANVSEDRAARNAALARLTGTASPQPLAKAYSTSFQAPGAGTASGTTAAYTGGILKGPSAIASRKSSTAAMQRPNLDFSVFQLDETLLKRDPGAAADNIKHIVAGASENPEFDAKHQRELMARLLTEKLDAMRREMEDREREERLVNDAQMAKLRAAFAAQRDEFERAERARLDTYCTGRLADLESAMRERLTAEERRLAEQFERARVQLREEHDAKREREEARLRHEQEVHMAQFKRDMEAKYAAALSEDTYRTDADRKRGQYEAQLNSELAQLRQDFTERKDKLAKSFEAGEAEERRRHEESLAEMRVQWQRRREQEEAAGARDLDAVKAKWRQQHELAAAEAEAKERTILRQKTDAYSAKLQQVQRDLQRQHDLATIELQNKITKTKAELAQQLQALEEKLARARQHTAVHNEQEIVASFVSTREKANAAVRDNDRLFVLQRRRREFLDRETKALDEMELQLEQRRLRLSTAENDSLASATQVVPAKSIQQPRPPSNRRETSREYTRSRDYVRRARAVTPSDIDSRSLSVSPSRAMPEDRRTSVDDSPAPKMQHNHHSYRSAASRLLDEALDFGGAGDDDSDDFSSQPSFGDGGENSRTEYAAVPSAIDMPFQMESKELSKTRKKLKAQRGRILQRQTQLEATRQRWKQELDDISSRLKPGDEATSAPMSMPQPHIDISDSTRFVDGFRLSERNFVNDLKQQDRRIATSSNIAAQRSRSLVHASPNYAAPSLIRPTRTATDNAFTPRKANTYTTPQGWMSEQGRQEEVLRNHGLWLHKFRKRVGIQRTTAYTGRSLS